MNNRRTVPPEYRHDPSEPPFTCCSSGVPADVTIGFYSFSSMLLTSKVCARGRRPATPMEGGEPVCRLT